MTFFVTTFMILTKYQTFGDEFVKPGKISNYKKNGKRIIIIVIMVQGSLVNSLDFK